MTLNELRAKLVKENRGATLAELQNLTEAEKTALAVQYAKLGKKLEETRETFNNSIHEQAKYLVAIEPDAEKQGKTLASYYRFKTGCDRPPENRATTLKVAWGFFVASRQLADGTKADGWISEIDFDDNPVNNLVKAVALAKKGVDCGKIAEILKRHGKDAQKQLKALDPDNETAITIPPTIAEMITKVNEFVGDSEPDKLKEIFQQLNAVTLAIEEKVGADTIDAWLASQPETAEVETANA